MIPELGRFALALGCVLALVQAILPLWGAQRGDARLMSAGPALALGQLLALAGAAGALVWSAVTDDFTVSNIANNSNSLEPLIYKITGTWGNHEGSILLWGLVLALCGGAVALGGRRRCGRACSPCSGRPRAASCCSRCSRATRSTGCGRRRRTGGT